jgi:putative ABC transport system permease protein
MPILSELRLAARSLWRTPAFTGAVVVILGLGIGANATLFSIADAVLFRPFPFVDQQRLVIAGEDASDPRSEISYRAYLDWRANLETFADLGVIGSTNWTLHLRLRDGLTAVPHRSVSANFFEILGAKPYLGRTFDRSDDRRGAARTLILGYGFWQRQFGGNPRVVGQVLASTEGAFTVVGVMPPDFRYPAGAEAWTPVVADLAAVRPNAMFDKLEDSEVGVLFVIGRLKPQATLAAARTDLNRVIAQASRAVPSRRRVESRLTPLIDDILGSARPGMWMLIGAVSVLLLAACANVAGLLLARSAGRRHELAVRMALGASRWALMRQASTSRCCWHSRRQLPPHSSRSLVFRWCARGCPTACRGLATPPSTSTRFCSPPSSVSRRRPSAGSRRRFRAAAISSRRCGAAVTPLSGCARPLRRALIVGELAAAVVLLTAAGLMLRSVDSLARLDLGFEARQLLAVKLSPPSSTTTDAEMRTVTERAIAELKAIPGVTAAAGVSNRPLLGSIGSDSPVRLEGQSLDGAGHNPFVNIETTTPEYLATIRGRLREGRFFTDGDRTTTEPVVVISEGFAARAWPGMPAIGKRLQVTALNLARPPGPVWWTVVGVVGDARNREITAPAFDVYVPFAQSPDRIETLVVRTAVSSEAGGAAHPSAASRPERRRRRVDRGNGGRRLPAGSALARQPGVVRRLCDPDAGHRRDRSLHHDGAHHRRAITGDRRAPRARGDAGGRRRQRHRGSASGRGGWRCDGIRRRRGDRASDAVAALRRRAAGSCRAAGVAAAARGDCSRGERPARNTCRADRSGGVSPS